jgi:acetoin utilization protein AcuB
MQAKDLINDLILPLRTSDTGAIALSWMDEMKVSHLPIVNNEAFLGLISEKEIYDMNNFDEPLGNYQLTLNKPFVQYGQHLFDVIRVVHSMQLSLIPVLNDNEDYLGCITQSRLLDEMAEVGSLKQPGGIIVLQLNEIDYSMFEISRLVESNDAKILSCCSRTFSDSTRMEVTLKLNKIDISAVIQTFTRFDYQIIASYSDENNYDEMLRDRFDMLMNYLNI